MSYYECKRCLCTFKQKIDIKRHISRKNKCNKAPQGYDYSKEEWMEKSLQMIKYIPIPLSKTNSLNDSTNLLNHSVNPLNHSTSLTNNLITNSSKLLNTPESNSVIKNEECKEFRCSTCFKKFSRKYNLQRHHCKIKEKLDNTSLLSSIIQPFNHKYYIILPFDIPWDDSHILHYYREKICTSFTPFTNLLSYLLMNPNNLNCLMDKINSTCILFQEKKENEPINTIQQPTSFFSFLLDTHNIQDIVPLIFEKLHTLLQHYLNSLLTTFNKNKEFLIQKKQEITEKYTQYFQNSDIKQQVSQHIINIYYNKKEETLFYFNKIQEILNTKTSDGY